MTKMGIYIPLIISFFIIFWVFYGFFIDSYYYKEIILGSFAALFAAIGMHRPEYSRFCKYITALFISATTFASYLTTNNHYIAILGIIFLLMVIAKDLKSLN